MPPQCRHLRASVLISFAKIVTLLANPAGGRCGLEDTPAGANYVAVPAQFFDPPE